MPKFGSSMSVCSAALVTEYRFSSVYTFFTYLAKLADKPYSHKVLEAEMGPGGSVRAVIAKQHNNQPLLDMGFSGIDPMIFDYTEV